MTDIEEEIRRQMQAEQWQKQTQSQSQTQSQTTANGASNVPHYAATPPEQQGRLARTQAKGGLMGALATIGIVLAKFGAPLLALLGKLKFLAVFGKVALTGGSMLLSMWLQAKVFGWPFAVGIVLLIFVHECGHAFAAWQRGIPFSGMVFIPFMGALVAHKRGGKDIAEDAYIGIMGPVFGTVGGLACVGIYAVTREPFWLVLAQFNFWINLFNLAPMAPLDGGWIVPLFSPKLLAVGVILLFLIAPHNPLIWILALLSLPRIIGGWKAKPDENPYYQASRATKWKFGLAYLGLAAFLALSFSTLHNITHTNRLPSPRPVAPTPAV